jgi:hypothetical protein
MLSEESTIVETMRSSCCNIFPFVIRLLIEPGENTVLSDQYEVLRVKLGKLVEIVENSLTLR